MPTIKADLLARLTEILPPDRVKYQEPMASYTSFRIGGPADALVFPTTAAELQSLLRFGAENGIPVTVMGRGSNLLVRDKGVRGMVIRLAGSLQWMVFSGDSVRAGSGTLLSELAMAAWPRGLGGLEFAHGIPGTLGGAVVMNAGAYDGEMAGVVGAVTVLDYWGKGRAIAREDLGFGYRSSILQGDDLIVVEVNLNLHRADPVAIKAKMDDYAARRRAKQPLDLPSAGSAFRRPPGHYAGSLIEQAGCKGLRVGDAQVSQLHAGFIVNRGRARAADVLALIAEVQKRVWENSGIHLEPEVKVVGED